MSPRYQFMTGFQMYQLEAASLEDALQFILGELKPNADAEAVVRSTLRELEPAAAAPPPKKKAAGKKGKAEE